jgi:hypothetical protein
MINSSGEFHPRFARHPVDSAEPSVIESRRFAELHRLVSWFLMGGCGAVHQSKPPREKIVLD